MRTVIETYYKALINNDINLLKTVVSDDIFGVRTYLENTLFINGELYVYCETNDIRKVDIVSCLEDNQSAKLVLSLTGENTYLLNVKMEFINNKIFKVYEVLIQTMLDIRQPSLMKEQTSLAINDNHNSHQYKKQLNPQLKVHST